MMKNKKNVTKRIFLIVSIFIAILVLSIILVVGYFYNKYSLDTNKLTSVNNGIRVYSAQGIDNTLYNTNRSIAEIETLPKYVKEAFIAVEDKRFYEHNGFDIKRIIKAAFVNLTTKSKSQGASTISQQLIKNALLTNEKTYSRKIKEVVLSIKMEKQFSKNEILEMYLNTIYFGSNAYGIENASMTYFNKSAKDLNINEACCLAGLIKSPAKYSPITNIENSLARKNLVAELLYNSQKITKNEYEEVINSDIIVSSQKNYDHSYEEEAIFEACELLNISERELINNDYQIITFKDNDLQKNVYDYNNDVISSTNSKNLDSLSVVSNNEGHILAYYANSKYNLHNLRRQSASILKPLAVYLPCITHNILTPATHILDEEINYNGFAPQNADKTFHGYVTCEKALADSLNIPAVKLLDCLGLKKSRDCLESLGININNSDMNLSLALGATKNGINLIDLMNAYTTLSNLGKYYKLCFVNKIIDKNGNVIYSHDNFFEQVVDEKSCFILNEMLKETAKTGTAKRLNSLNMPLCSKTGTVGTSAGNTDLYNITYSSEHTLLTWIANIKDDYLPNNLLSSSQPTEINKRICEVLYKTNLPHDFIKPEGVEYLPYSIIELENNHKLIAPKSNEYERYIAYEYFKEDYTPAKANDNDEITLNSSISNSGCNLSFNAYKNENYNLYKQINNEKVLIDEISNFNGTYSHLDNNIFKYETIQYYIENSSGELISNSVIIKPKDYIINKLNNDLLSTKKKWYV